MSRPAVGDETSVTPILVEDVGQFRAMALQHIEAVAARVHEAAAHAAREASSSGRVGRRQQVPLDVALGELRSCEGLLRQVGYRDATTSGGR
jgi:hypothetical protein